METVGDEILANALKFLDKARADRKQFFLWLNPTRMHVITHLSEKYENLRYSENGRLLSTIPMRSANTPMIGTNPSVASTRPSTPRPNPHSARCTIGTPIPAISCLGALPESLRVCGPSSRRCCAPASIPACTAPR
jgi:hypothetical protein